MLYIYHVDVGHLFAFDMNYAMKKVRDLKKEIERSCTIPYVNQVLVVSGGQIMDGKRVVGSYQAGTDNNPIWLVDNRLYNQNQPPKAYIPEGPDDRLREFLESSMNLPPTYDTIVTRAQLSMRFHENGREEYRICETLVKDQHFQHQGWASLKCTLEDKGSALDKNKNRFLKAYDQFLSDRETAMNQLQQYEDTRKLIGKIPIPRCLDHYAKKCTDRLMKTSSMAMAERKISNFVSCVDRLEKSEYYSGSGPPSSQSQGMSDSGEQQKHLQQQDAATAIGHMVQRSSPVSIRRQSGDRGSAASSDSAAGSQGSRYLPRNESVTSTGSSAPLVRREVIPGFTSPDVQSPCATPKKLSHIHEEDEQGKSFGRVRKLSEAEAGIEGPPAVTRGIKFEISPTGSQISQASSHGSEHGLDLRSISPSPYHQKTLSDWIRGNDSKDPIEMVKKELEEKFSRLTPELRSELEAKCAEAMKSLDNKSMKEFKGLDRRLAGLEQLMLQMKDLVRQQSDMAQGFIQNQQRARAERDASVLPDLCSSHKKQLSVMIENHQRLCDIKRRITAAKQELCTVLHARIRWIMHMEEKLRDVDNDIVMTQGMLGRMFTYMKTLRQVHETPSLFAEAVVEGYRRKKFASKYKEWADIWAEENSNLYRREVERRKEFNQHLSGHFLLKMFTGYGEEPPEFATKPPDPFDMELPAISADDIESLRQEVPEIAHILIVPDETEIGKIISSNTLRGESSTSVVTGSVSQHQQLSSSPYSTTDQATSTSFCLTGSLQDDNTSDIVVLNANGEQGVLTPSPEHKQSTNTASLKQTTPTSCDDKSSQLKQTDNDLTQSVEVISNEAANRTDRGFTLPFNRYVQEDPRSMSVQEPRSYEASPDDCELNFHSLRSLSLDEVRLNSGDFKPSHLGTSPDLDDYATADFYIDESIPSAMSASSPERTIAELHLQLEEKSNEMAKKDEELQQLQEDSTSNKDRCERLTKIVSNVQQALENIKGMEVPSLKEQLCNLKKETTEQKDQFQTDITVFNEKMSQYFLEFSQISQRRDDDNQQLQQQVEELQKKKEEREAELSSQMEESVCVISEEWEEKLNSANQQLTQEKLKYEEIITDLKNQLASENDKLVSMQKETEQRESALKQEKDVVEKKVQEVESDKLKFQENLTVETEKLQTVEKQVKEIEEQVLSLNEKITELESMKEELLKQLKESKEGFEQKQTELQNEFSERLKVEEEKLQSSEKDIANYKENISTLENAKADIEKQLQESIKEYEEKLVQKQEEFNEKIKVEEDKVSATQKDLDEQKCLLEDKTIEFEKKCKLLEEEKVHLTENIKKVEEEFETKIKELKEQSETELQETKSQMMLENEVEMDKVRSDLEIEVVEKEQELDKMKADLDSVTKQLEEIRLEKEKVQEELTKQFQEEKDQIVQILEKETTEKMLQKESELKATLEKEGQARLDQALKEKDEETQGMLDKAKETTAEEHKALIEELKANQQKELEDQYLQNEEKLDKLKGELTERYGTEREKERLQLSESNKEIVSAMEAEKDKEVKEVKESLAFDFHKRITELRADIDTKDQEIEELREAVKGKESQLEKVKEDPGLVTLDKHNSVIEELRSDMEKQKELDVKEALDAIEKAHGDQMSQLIEKMQKDKHDSLDQMKTSLTGEKQVLFNEALNKVVADKDRVIEELKQKHSETETMMDKVKDEMTKLKAELNDTERNRDQYRASLNMAEDSTEVSAITKKYEEEIRQLKHQLQQHQLMTSMTSSVMTQSVVPVSEASSLQDRITQLEVELKTKEQEITKLKDKLQDKMGELSMSPATQNLVKDKISITSCNKGDVVLLCLDDKYDHYVVFTVGVTLHFLHSDCLDALNLKPAPGDTQRLWVLAEIVDKEYCQAKKAQNRFKVPVGTKFYRVRCKPWSPPNVTPGVSQQKQQQDSGKTAGRKQHKQKAKERTESASSSSASEKGADSEQGGASAAILERPSSIDYSAEDEGKNESESGNDGKNEGGNDGGDGRSKGAIAKKSKHKR